MSDEKLDKIMAKVSKVDKNLAVLTERFGRVDELEERVERVESKLTFHDKIVGAVCLASGILITLIKYGKL